MTTETPTELEYRLWRLAKLNDCRDAGEHPQRNPLADHDIEKHLAGDVVKAFDELAENLADVHGAQNVQLAIKGKLMGEDAYFNDEDADNLIHAMLLERAAKILRGRIKK